MTIRRARRAFTLFPILLLVSAAAAVAADWTLVGWNNLGMHCMDADYAVFSLLPPYNTVLAQLVDPNGSLVTTPALAGIVVTYEAVADPDGSVNSTSIGKTDFWDHAGDLFGVTLAPDAGLAGFSMPGAPAVARPMSFDAARNCFVAEGIPITPYDDAGHKNPYPLLRLVARRNGEVLAQADVVLPVSDEMDCRSCHASGSSAAAQPSSGWVSDPDPQRDMRLNILLLHDEREFFREEFQQALAEAGYSSNGLYATVVDDHKAVLCARCHLSEALPGSGMAGIEPLTTAVHRRMAFVQDPKTGLPLDDDANRSACYRCHPGSVTRCLRGAMGAAVAEDGTLAMQCQSCHGHMLDVAASERTGWLDEPACQQCHTGTAMRNNGEIRYTSVFEENGSVRVPLDSTYATNADTPAPGLSLYRFSVGHGGLQCEACHGSTHAEYPSLHRNDNLLSQSIQGHVGMLVECRACHGDAPLAAFGGPHGMHPVGQEWIERHPDEAEEGGAARCRDCHGQDYRGTVLSRVKADRDLDTDFGAKHFWRGFQVGCYTCHLGPTNEEANPNRPPQVADASASTVAGAPVAVALDVSDADGDATQTRVVSQPAHGTAAIQDGAARYFPEPGFTGSDAFTVAATDGSTDSNLARVEVDVGVLVADANCDGRVSAADLVAIARRIADEQVLVCDADVDDSGIVDGADVDALVPILFSP